MLIRCLVTAGGLSIASAADAQVIYDNLGSGTDGVAFFNDLVVEDLTLGGGGLLQGVTVGMTGEAEGEVATADLTLTIARDGGNGMPDFGMGDDLFILQQTIPGVEVAVGGVTEVTFDVSDWFHTVEEGELLFVGVESSNPGVGHLFFGAPDPGSTDPFVLSVNQMGPVQAPGVKDPDSFPNSLGLGFRLEATELPGAAPGEGVEGEPIGFESLDEGFQGMELEVDGVTFFDAFSGFPPIGVETLAIDDGTGVWDVNPDMLDFVQGNLLQINAFSGGPDGYSFAILKRLRMSVPETHTGASLSVAYVTEDLVDGIDYTDGEITLMALLAGEPVATDVIKSDNILGTSFGGTFTFGAGTLEISGVEFDSLVLFTNGLGAFGALQMGVDNVVIGQEGGCVADFNGDGSLDILDFIALQNSFQAGDESADINGDGELDILDFVAFQALFQEGCE